MVAQVATVTNSGTSSAAVFDFTIPAGVGIVAGGTTGQALIKNSNTNYDVTWGNVDALPSQTGNNGKYLKTDGSAASWSTIPTKLQILVRAGTITDVSLANGYLPVTNRAGSTIQVSIV